MPSVARMVPPSLLIFAALIQMFMTAKWSRGRRRPQRTTRASDRYALYVLGAERAGKPGKPCRALRVDCDDVSCGIANTTAITRLLNSLQETGGEAQEELILRLNDELCVLARRKMVRA